MRFLQHNPRSRHYTISFLLAFLKTAPTLSSSTLLPPSNIHHLFHTCKRLVPLSASKPINNNNNNNQPLILKTNGRLLSYTSPAHSPYSEERLTMPPLSPVKYKLKIVGIDAERCIVGENRLLCPMCKGGDSSKRSLSLRIDKDGLSAVWICFRAKCGWKGRAKAFADSRSPNLISKVKIPRHITEKSLKLEPLCHQLIDYFSERLITRRTLERNRVMQKKYGDNEIAIAFTYRRRGKLVNCKYRDVNKKFWQEKDAEKTLYGLDDIEEASDIIIVEGEIDKLSMEEAGIYNCVSVPDGAPPTFSQKDLPPEDQDTEYQYLWNCKDYLMKASRIILATDGDLPGQALAEELARRLGIQRCWRVRWPKKNKVDHFEDANEVLMYLGADALKEVVENAELYPIKGLYNFRDFYGEIDAYYHQTFGDEFGVSTRWRSLDSRSATPVSSLTNIGTKRNATKPHLHHRHPRGERRRKK